MEELFNSLGEQIKKTDEIISNIETIFKSGYVKLDKVPENINMIYEGIKYDIWKLIKKHGTIEIMDITTDKEPNNVHYILLVKVENMPYEIKLKGVWYDYHESIDVETEKVNLVVIE